MNPETEIQTSNELILQIQSAGLETETSKSLETIFTPFFEQAKQWKEKADKLIVTSSDQLREMKEARIARLALKDIRVEVEKKRKSLKEDSLRKSKAIDGIANVIKYLIEPIEEHLQAQEDFAAIAEAKRLDDQKETRIALLKPYDIQIEFYDVRHMSDEAFNQLLENTKRNDLEKKEAAKKAEAERIAKEKAELEEREKIRVENERLKREADEKQKLFAAERAKAEKEREALEAQMKKEKQLAEAKFKAEQERNAAIIKAQQEKDAKIKAEADAKAKSEADELKAKQQAEKKASQAPDKTKLISLASEIVSMKMPEMKSEEGKRILSATQELLNKVNKFLLEKSETL